MGVDGNPQSQDEGETLFEPLAPDEAVNVISWMLGGPELPAGERERRYLALFESLPQISWVNHPSGQVAYFNRLWAEYTGLSTRPSRDEWLWAFWPEDRESLPVVREPAVARGEAYQAEVRLRRVDGVYRWHQCRVVPLHDTEGGIFGWLGTAADVDDIRRAEQTLRDSEERFRQLAAAADAASRAKDQFLAVLSHELRTPLTPVLTLAQRLEGDPRLPQELRGWVKTIRRNVALETRLIDDLLDHTRISRGKVTLQRETVDFHEKIRHTATICDSDARGKGLELVLDLRATRRWVRVDPARLQQVLWNLVKNAIKFTPEGGTITIRTEDADDGSLSDTGGIRIQVCDTGVGIDTETLPRIFTAFEQGGREVTRMFGGLGLGLSICKGLVELHGGVLTAESEGRGRGAVFTLRLPESMAEPAARPVRGAGGGPAGGRPGGCRVLLVEDHPDTLQVMAELVEMFGYTVRTADSVASALQIAAGEPIDVLVSDIGLPDGSGLDLMRQLLARQRIQGVALSGFGMEEDLHRSRDAGFLEHLTKPVDLGQLERALARAAAAART